MKCSTFSGNQSPQDDQTCAFSYGHQTASTYFLRMKYIRLKSLLASLLISLATSQSLAGASDWFKTEGAKMRLIAIPGQSPDEVRAGLEFELENGWKTYWRTPGSSGIPPQIHFLGSKNLQSATVKYPTPQFFEDDGSLGYKKHVVFPIDLKTERPNAPLTLNASGMVGICSDICIPVPFRLSLTKDLTGGTPIDLARILSAADLDLPVLPTDSQKVLSTSLSKGDGKFLEIEAKIPPGSGSVELFIEGPDTWYLPQPTLTSKNNETAKFELNLKSAPKDVRIIGTELSFTLVVNGKGTEQVLAVEY